METPAKELTPEFTLLDELFYLKNSLLVNGQLNSNHIAISTQILEILEEDPSLSYQLLEQRFPENELLFLLRSGLFSTAIQIATLVLKTTHVVPAVFLSKSFLFFISNKLFQSSEFNNGLAPRGVKSSLILNFATQLVLNNRESVRSLYSSGFFILAGALITPECCEFYNSIFIGIYYFDTHIESERESKFESKLESRPDLPISVGRSFFPAINLNSDSDGIYEIHRKQFDPEVVFSDQQIFQLKYHRVSYRHSIFNHIYSNCYNFLHFVDLDTAGMLDMLLYKRINYFNESINLLIVEKNLKAIKYYRRALEVGMVPIESLLQLFIHMLDDKLTKYDATLILYFYKDKIKDKQINESRIRSIFQTLEYACSDECLNKSKTENSINFSNTSQFMNSTIRDESIHSVGYGNESIHNAEYGNESIHNAEYGNEFIVEYDNESIHSVGYCNRLKIILLIKQLYKIIPHELFYRPSYLILIKSCINHCKSATAFIAEYFNEFLSYLMADRLNMARVLFSHMEPRRRTTKYVEIQLDGEPENRFDEYERINKQMHMEVRNGMLESDEQSD